MNVAIHVVAAGCAGQDRAAALPFRDGHLLILADGAGGTSGGDRAADAVLEGAGSFRPVSVSDCVYFLRSLDRRLSMIGEATAVIAILLDGQVWGASVGDSGAWLISNSGIVDLTRDQKRKPLLGSGNAMPVGFGPLACESRLLLGSDGLFKYAPHERIRDLSSNLPLGHAATALVDAARLPSGALQDDVAVIVAGEAPSPSTN